MKSRILFVGIIFTLAGISCSFEYDSDVEDKAALNALPYLSMSGLEHAIIKNGKKIVSLNAKKLEIYKAQNQRVLVDVEFTQFDEKGEVLARGTAGKATQNISTQDVNFENTVLLEVMQNKSSISAEALEWKFDSGIFLSKLEDQVTITEKGSKVVGHGLTLDMIKRKLYFDGPASGELNE